MGFSRPVYKKEKQNQIYKKKIRAVTDLIAEIKATKIRKQLMDYLQKLEQFRLKHQDLKLAEICKKFREESENHERELLDEPGTSPQKILESTKIYYRGLKSKLHDKH